MFNNVFAVIKNKLLILLLLSIFISGCTSTKIKPEDRHKLSSINLNSYVEKPKNLSYIGPYTLSSFATVVLLSLPGHLVGGVAGAALDGGLSGLSEGSQTPEGNDLKIIAETNNIFIDKIVFEEASNLLRQSKNLNLIESTNQKTATLNIIIVQYGFGVRNRFSSKHYPILHVKFNLIDNFGIEIWKNDFLISPLHHESKMVLLNDIKENPDVIEKTWRSASNAAIKPIVNNLIKLVND